MTNGYFEESALVDHLEELHGRHRESLIAPGTGSYAVSGRWRGGAVEAELSWGEDGHSWNVRAFLSAPLWAGIRATPSIRATAPFPPSQAWFGGCYQVESFDPPRAHALLAPAGEDLVAASARGVDVSIDDTHVSLSASGKRRGVLTQLLHTAVEIAGTIDASRAKLGVPEHVPHGPWSTFAQRRQMAFDPERMRLAGRVEGLEAHAVLRYERSVAKTSVRICWDERPAAPIHLRSRAAPPDFFTRLLGGSAQVGDRELDDAFYMHASSRAALKPLRTRGLRDQLLALSRGALLVVDDVGVYREEPSATADLEPVMIALARVAHAIAGTTPPPVAAAPFR
jgi:hypothetical protein